MGKTVSKGSHLLEGKDIPFTSGLLFFRDHLETAPNREKLFKKRFGPPEYGKVYYKPKVVLEKLCLTSRNGEESSSFSILTFALLSTA